MTLQANNLNPILNNDIKNLYNSNLLKARILKVASIINFLSIIIFTTYLLSFIGFSTAAISMANMTIGIAIPVLSISLSILYDFSKSFYKIASFNKKILSEFKILNSENDTQIKKYLNIIKCSNITNVKQILPALAHYRVWIEKKNTALEEIKKIKDIQSDDENFKYEMLEYTHDIYEKEVLFAKLKLAQIHHIMNNPTDKRMAREFGKVFTMSFSRRMASFLQGEDYYFVFNDETQKQRHTKGISFIALGDLEISDISKLIFEN